MSSLIFWNLTFSVVFSVLIITQIQSANAWAFSGHSQDDQTIQGAEVGSLEETEEKVVSQKSSNSDVEVNTLVLEEEEDVEDEQNLKCAQHFNKNLYRYLKSMMPANSTQRFSRQDDTDTDPNDLVASMLNLEFSQVIGPVLRIVGSAAASNATAIDESYNSLPLAVRYQVNDFIKFAVDLLSTT